MTVRSLIVCVLIISGSHVVAQDRPEANENPAPSERKVSHYVGLQANQLVRQILSFGGNNTPVTNPYALTYTVNSKSNGVGFATALGYSLIQTKTNDNFTSVTSKINDLAFRIGIEKKSYLSRNWLAGFGVDVLMESNNSETKTNFGGSNQQTVITTKTTRAGFGPRVLLNYQFNEKLMIGTEASFYFKTVNTETKTQGIQTPPEPNSKLKVNQFTLPAALFLVMKF